MGRRSSKSEEEKTVYEKARERCGLTREQAASLSDYVLSADRIEKIENGRALPHPEDIIIMSRIYKDTLLCNHFCSRECPIGRLYVPEVEIKDLSRITLETLSSLHALTQLKDRFIDIAADSAVTEDEMQDFMRIRERLEEISLAADSLRYWMDKNLPEA